MTNESSPLSLGGSIVNLSRVLAAVDFSAPARRAFDYALDLAKRHGAKLAVVHAGRRTSSFNWAGEGRLALKTDLRRMADEAGVPFTYRVQHGDASEIILLHAQSALPDVIVVGSHPRRGLDRLRAGSVGDRVIAKTTVPVLLVPARLRTDAVGAFHHVAVAVDLAGSEGAVNGEVGAGKRHGRSHHVAACGAGVLVRCTAALEPVRRGR